MIGPAMAAATAAAQAANQYAAVAQHIQYSTVASPCLNKLCHSLPSLIALPDHIYLLSVRDEGMLFDIKPVFC